MRDDDFKIFRFQNNKRNIIFADIFMIIQVMLFSALFFHVEGSVMRSCKINVFYIIAITLLGFCYSRRYRLT